MNAKMVIFLVSTFLTGCSSFGPGMATSNDLRDYKMGSACSGWVLAPSPVLTWWGRNDILTAAKNANISKIAVVDHSTHWYFLYGETCTHVYGTTN